MHNNKGYVCIEAEQIKFPVEFTTIIEKNSYYQLQMSFGGKTIYFDPINGRSESSRTREGVLRVLKERQDIEDLENVIKKFISDSEHVIKTMLSHGLGYQTTIPFETCSDQ